MNQAIPTTRPQKTGPWQWMTQRALDSKTAVPDVIVFPIMIGTFAGGVLSGMVLQNGYLFFGGVGLGLIVAKVSDVLEATEDHADSVLSRNTICSPRDASALVARAKKNTKSIEYLTEENDTNALIAATEFNKAQRKYPHSPEAWAYTDGVLAERGFRDSEVIMAERQKLAKQNQAIKELIVTASTHLPADRQAARLKKLKL